MTELYVRHIQGEPVETALARHGGWTIASIEQPVGWSNTDFIVEYEGCILILLGWGKEKDLLPAVAVHDTDLPTGITANRIINKFLSALNWVSSGSIRVESRLGGGLNWRLQAAMLLQFYYPPVHRYSRNSTSLHVQQKSNNFSYAWS